MGLMDQAQMMRTMGPQLAKSMDDLWKKFSDIHKDLENVIASQNETTKALVSIYAQLVELCKKENVEIKEPLTNMTLEDE